MALTAYNLDKLASLQPAIQPLARNLLRIAEEQGIPVKVVSSFRSPEEQERLYTSGAGVTKAPALLSYHNHGLAFDVVPVEYLKYKDWNPTGALWPRLGAIGKSLGLDWGGAWSDPDYPHFQLTAAPIKELKSYYEKFKTIMPIEIRPTEAGLILALIVMAAALYVYRELV